MRSKPNLDLLRTLAVSMVVLQHILLTMRIYWIGSLDISWLGYFGVFLFFIHTSLVLMWSLERNSDPVGFYVRRAFRIYPLAILTILVMITFHLPAIRNGNGDAVYWAPGLKNVIANLLLVQNLFWGPEILGVMWSLPMECDMYIMLPFLFSMTAGRSAIWRLLFLWFALVGMNSYLLPAQSAIFPMFIPHFLSGILAYILFSRVQPRLPGFTMPLLVIGLLILFLSFPSMRIAWWFTLVLALAIPFFRPISGQVACHCHPPSGEVFLWHLFGTPILCCAGPKSSPRLQSPRSFSWNIRSPGSHSGPRLPPCREAIN